MRVVVCPLEAGGGWQRMRWAAELLDLEILEIPRFLRPQDFRLPDDADVVVVQCPTATIFVLEIIRIMNRGVKVVVDIDDNYHALNPKSWVWRNFHETNPLQNKDNLKLAAEVATLVTVSTPQLAEVYGAHGRVEVIGNCVPKKYWDYWEKKQWGVGWPGNPTLHEDDLEVLRGALGGMNVRHLGPSSEDVEKRLGLTLVESTEWADLASGEYARHIAGFKVGIAPLARSTFNAGKSWLKALEYGALGVPCVVSDSPAYEALGIGIRAKKPKDWKAGIKRLLGDQEFWLAERDRNSEIAKEWTVEKNLWRWEQAWLGTTNTAKHKDAKIASI